MATTQHQIDPYQVQSRKSGTALAVGLVLLALMAGFALGKGGILGKVGGKKGAVALNADGTPQNAGFQVGDTGLVFPVQIGGEANPTNVQAGQDPATIDLSAGAGPIAPNLNATADPQAPNFQAGDKMPREVREWLLHLERTEKQRNQMATSQLASVMTMGLGMGAGGLGDLTAEAFGEEPQNNQNYDPSKRDKVHGQTVSQKQAWKDLNRFFNSKQPPTECVPIKNAYEQCLGETSAMMQDILDQLDKSQSDPQGALQSLMGMMGTSGPKIDAYGKETDNLVGKICFKYETFKWFSVTGDIGGGLGGLGLGASVAGSI